MECRYGKGPNGRGRWREKKNNKGWQYLALALTGTPFTIAVRKANKGNVFKTISALKNKYEATEVGEYGELTREFIGATMKSNKEDPEAYIGSFLKFQSHKYTRHRLHIPDGKQTICDKKTQNLVPSKSTRTQNLCHAQITPES